MIRFLKFTALVLIICIGCVALLEYLFRNYVTRGDQLYNDYYSHNQTIETLYIGNSHIGAFIDIIPPTTPNAGNMAMGGQDIFRMYSTIKTVVPKSPHLKKIIMGLDYDLIGYNQTKSGQEYIDRQFYKYTGMLYNNNTTNRLMSESSFFRSNRDIAYLFSKEEKQAAKKDFIPLNTTPVTTVPVAGNSTGEVAVARHYDSPTLNNCKKRAEEHTLLKFKTKNIPENLDYLSKIIDICKANNIELVFIDPPKTECYKEYSGKETVALAKHLIDSFTLARQVPYRDFYNDSSFNDAMFADFDHMNRDGVQLLLNKLSAQ